MDRATVLLLLFERHLLRVDDKTMQSIRTMNAASEKCVRYCT